VIPPGLTAKEGRKEAQVRYSELERFLGRLGGVIAEKE
jgi:hypothetical protein